MRDKLEQRDPLPESADHVLDKNQAAVKGLETKSVDRLQAIVDDKRDKESARQLLQTVDITEISTRTRSRIDDDLIGLREKWGISVRVLYP